MKDKNLKYVERDVSWMYFNHRILNEAKEERVPLLERLSFLGIYSSNLDEFFRVRVASLNRMLDREMFNTKILKTIRQTLKTINQLNEQYSHEYEATTAEVIEKMKEYGMRIVNEENLNAEQQSFLKDLYYDRLNGSTNPIWLHRIKDLSELEDDRIYLAVVQRDDNKKEKYAVIKVPDKTYGRWVKIPDSDAFQNIMYLDDVIRFCLPMIFRGTRHGEYKAYSFKFNKDAEMEVESEGDFGTLERISMGVNSRKKGSPVRIIYDSGMPKELRKNIFARLNADSLDTALAAGRYQNHKDLINFPDCGHKELKYPQWKPLLKPEFKEEESVLNIIRQRDLFIHVPYHSFDAYITVLREAAIKPEVKEIKTTLYRLAKDSKVVEALICAARNGKKVTVVMELLARFDEKSNIKWSRRMQAAGINVVFGVEGLKVHSKLLYIKARKGDICVVGTGNFHERNARSYTDYFVMTARKKTVSEVEKVFQFIAKPFSQYRFTQLMVSPNSMKSRILRLFDTEIKNAAEGKEAWVKIKINHITDKEVIAKMYAASKAGVHIDALVRGNCSVVPGVKDQSENINVTGIIDRYLEHSRILIFANGGQPKYYIGSADWMPRNLQNRIEVMTPVQDPDIQKDLMRTINFGLQDTTNARIVDGHGGDKIRTPTEGDIPLNSQTALHDSYNQE